MTWTSLDEVGGGTTNLYGSYVYASYFLTGESRCYDRRVGDFKRMTPYENFWLVRTPRGASAGWGAWEAACRWSYLDLSEASGQPLYSDIVGPSGQQLNDLTVGRQLVLESAHTDDVQLDPSVRPQQPTQYSDGRRRRHPGDAAAGRFLTNTDLAENGRK